MTHHTAETLLRDMIVDTMEFETDEPIIGADFIEWFAVFREKAQAVLEQAKPQLTRKQIQDVYIRVCKDSGFQMEFIQATIFAAKLLKLHPWGVYDAFGDMSAMKAIATGSHPITR